MRKQSNTYYKFCPIIQTKCNDILECDISGDELESINFIINYGQHNGYLEYSHMRTIGILYKFYLQGGKYIHYNWWNDVERIKPKDLPEFTRNFKEKINKG